MWLEISPREGGLVEGGVDIFACHDFSDSRSAGPGRDRPKDISTSYFYIGALPDSELQNMLERDYRFMTVLDQALEKGGDGRS